MCLSSLHRSWYLFKDHLKKKVYLEGKFKDYFKKVNPSESGLGKVRDR